MNVRKQSVCVNDGATSGTSNGNTNGNSMKQRKKSLGDALKGLASLGGRRADEDEDGGEMETSPGETKSADEISDSLARLHAVRSISGKKGAVSIQKARRGTHAASRGVVASADVEGDLDSETKRASREPDSLEDFGDVLRQSFRLDLNDVNGEVVRLKFGSNTAIAAAANGASAAKLGAKSKASEIFTTARVMKYGKNLCNELVFTSHVEGIANPKSIYRRLLQLDGSPFVQAPPPPVPVAHDPVGQDILAIPRVLTQIMSDW